MSDAGIGSASGLAAMGVMTYLLTAMRRRGIISPQEARECVDSALLGLEEIPPGASEDVPMARAVLEHLLQGLVRLDAEDARRAQDKS